MSVPADRMAPRNPSAPMKDPTKIMGLKKPVFYVIIILGILLAYYIYKRSQSSSAANTTLDNADAGTTEGVTAADIGGTPADNSFATQTDETALEEQIQSLQNSLFQLQQSNGGNGAGLPGGTSTGTSTSTPVTTPITIPKRVGTPILPPTTQPIPPNNQSPFTLYPNLGVIPNAEGVPTPIGGTIHNPVVAGGL